MGLCGTGYTANNKYMNISPFISHLEHIASLGVKTDPHLLGLNATPAVNTADYHTSVSDLYSHDLDSS